MVYYYASNNTMTVTNKEAKQFDEQLEKLRKEKELELLMKKFKEKGGNVEKLKPQRITAQMKRDNTIWRRLKNIEVKEDNKKLVRQVEDQREISRGHQLQNGKLHVEITESQKKECKCNTKTSTSS